MPENQKHHWAHRSTTWLSLSPRLASCVPPLPLSTFLLSSLSPAAFSLAFSLSHYPEIRRLFPRAQMQTVPNASHWVHSDCPQDFMAAVQRFPGLRVAGQRGRKPQASRLCAAAPCFCTEALRWALRGHVVQKGSDLKL